MKSIYKTYIINASPSEVWKALTEPAYIEAWGGTEVEMSDQVDGKFSLWDGSIHGTNVEVEPERKLVQEWYGGIWEDPSSVQFTLHEEADGTTRLELVQENVPDEDAADIDSGWDTYYLGAIKDFLELS